MLEPQHQLLVRFMRRDQASPPFHIIDRFYEGILGGAQKISPAYAHQFFVRNRRHGSFVEGVGPNRKSAWNTSAFDDIQGAGSVCDVQKPRLTECSYWRLL